MSNTSRCTSSGTLRVVGRPVAYYPQLAKLLGSVNASILFGHFFYWMDKTDNPLGVYKTAEEIELETGLSIQEQRTARKKLNALGILIETEKRIEHRIYYQINFDKFDEIIGQHSPTNESTAPNEEINIPELQNQHSGSDKSTAVIRTIDYSNRLLQKTTTIKNIKNTKKINPIDLLLAENVEQQTAEDYLKIRKEKRAPLTKTALQGILEEAKKANLTAEQVITICCKRNWVGFEAKWLLKEHSYGNDQKPSVKDIPVHTQGGAFLAKDIF